MDIVKVFESYLKKHSTAMVISKEVFANKCEIHRPYISAVECHRCSISIENIQRTANALEIETYKLFIENKKAIVGKPSDCLFALERSMSNQKSWACKN